jgi:hypothetical protein
MTLVTLNLKFLFLGKRLLKTQNFSTRTCILKVYFIKQRIPNNKIFTQPKDSEGTFTNHFKRINDAGKSFICTYPADIHEIQNNYSIRHTSFHTSRRLARHINVAPLPTAHTRDAIPGESDRTTLVT